MPIGNDFPLSKVLMELTDQEREDFLNASQDNDDLLPADMDLEEYVERNARNFVNRREMFLIFVVILVVFVFFVGPIEIAAVVISIFVKSPEAGHHDGSSSSKPPRLRPFNNTSNGWT